LTFNSLHLSSFQTVQAGCLLCSRQPFFPGPSSSQDAHTHTHTYTHIHTHAPTNIHTHKHTQILAKLTSSRGGGGFQVASSHRPCTKASNTTGSPHIMYGYDILLSTLAMWLGEKGIECVCVAVCSRNTCAKPHCQILHWFTV